MEIGDKFTDEEFQEIKKQYKTRSFGYTWFLLNKDLRFERFEEPKTGAVMWELVSTFESRVKDQDTGHAMIHRKEQKYTSRYYDTKN